MVSQNRLIDGFRRCQKVLSDIALGTDIKQVFAQLQDITESMGERRFASLLRLDQETKTLHKIIQDHLPDEYNQAMEGLEIGECVGSCGASAYLGQTVIAEDLQMDPNWQQFRELASQHALAACWSVPIILSSGDVFGTLAIYSVERAYPTHDELEILQLAAHIASVAIDKQELEEKLRFSATHDPLTQLLNRAEFEFLANKALKLAERRQEPFCILYIDLKDFKMINDVYGHDMGDTLLQIAANVLEAELRESDLSGRRGGDEFLVGLVGTSSLGAAKYIERIRKRFALKQQKLPIDKAVTFSIGVAEVNSAHYVNLTRLISLADEAMYQDKHERDDAN